MGAAVTKHSECGLLLGALALVAAGVVAPALVHVDETDSQLYQVVARHLVEDNAWVDLRYLPEVHPRFREHLPFGLWPAAATIRLFGEQALPVPYTAFTLGALALIGWVSTRLYGAWAGVASVLVLGTSESFFLYGSRTLLEPPLLFLATAAAVPLLFEQVTTRGWVLALLLASAATLVKGPFGLLPLAAASASRALLSRSWRDVVLGVVVTSLAAVPVAAFLLHDRAFGDGSWWAGYLHAQLLASMEGTPGEEAMPFWFPWRVILGQITLAVPLAAVAVVRSVRQSDVHSGWSTRVLALSCGLMLVALGLPARKLYTHELIAFPFLACLAGAGASPFLEKWLGAARRVRAGALALAALSVVAWVSAFARIGRHLVNRPCLASSEMSAEFAAIRPGEAVWVISELPNWALIASLAAEQKLVPYPATRLIPASASAEAAGLGPRVAIARAELVAPGTPHWLQVARARGWVLLRSF